MLIISHRGYIKKFKENTYKGIKYALTEAKCDGVEFDVRVTKDKKLVIIHDFFINRVSDGNGLVNELSLRKLKKYNFGTKKEPQKIATLEQILNIESNKYLFIELKMTDKEYYRIKNKLIKKLNCYTNKNIVIISFNLDILKDLRKNIAFKCGILSNKHIKDNTFDLYLMNHDLFNDQTYNKLKRKEIFLWTINTLEDIKKLKDKPYYNKLNFITDYPDLF